MEGSRSAEGLGDRKGRIGPFRPERRTDALESNGPARLMEEQCRAIFEHSDDAIVFVDPPGTVSAVNPRVESMLGYTRAELVGKSLTELHLVAPEHLPALTSLFEVSAGSKGPHAPSEGRRVVDMPLRHKTGRTVWVEASATAVAKGSEMLGFFGIFRDVTTGHRIRAQLARALAWQEAIFEGSRDAVLITNDQLEFAAVNLAAVKLTGYVKQELLRMRALDVCGEKDHRLCRGLHDRVVAGEEVVQETRLRRKNGTLVDTEMSIRPITIGGRTYVHATVRDITDRKRAEQLLRRERDKAQSYLDLAGVIMVALDGARRVTLINRTGCEVLGYTEAEVLGKHWFDHFLPERVRESAAAVFSGLMAGERERYEYVEVPILTKAGAERVIAWHNTVLTDETGTIVGTLSSGEDTTYRRRAEKAAVSGEQLLMATFRACPVGIGLVRDRVIRWCNKAVEDLTGYPAGFLVGQSVRRLYASDEEYERIGRVIRDGLDRTGIAEAELSIVREDGTTFDGHLRVSLFDPLNPSKGYVGALTDVTRRKKTERQLLDYQGRLRALAAELTLAQERERRRIAVGVHDQIAQRLALAKLALQALSASSREAHTSRTLEDVCRQIDQVIEDAHSLTFELSCPTLYEAGFEAAVESWLARQVRDRHGIEYTFRADPFPLNLDKEMRVTLFQVVRELLTNVIKHAQAKQVDVRIERVGRTVQIVVQDDGIGFGPIRASRGGSRSGGFGLFNVREKLGYLGGSFKAESARDKGTRVVIGVPLRRASGPGEKERQP